MEVRIIHLLARKLSGEATAEELAELDELLTHNPEAVYYAELIIQLWDEEKMRKPSNTDIVYLKHLAKHRPVFEKEPAPGETLFSPPPPPSQQKRTRRSWSLVVLLLAAGIACYLITRSLPSAPAAIPSPVMAEYTAAAGSRKSIMLPDGTKVRLNGGSLLHYDPHMLETDTRDVGLSGEAYFDVAKDKQRPFIIHTDKIAIRVLGTVFNVRAYPGERITETTLLGGSVELTVNNKPYQKIILKPREKFALIDDASETAIRHVQADPQKISSASTLTDSVQHNKEKLIVQDVVPVSVEDKLYVKEVSWVEDNFVFQNETLEELAPKMEQWWNVKITIDNRRLDAYHYTGVFHKETITQALEALQLIRPFTFKINDDHVSIH